ncbi:hypothetical protein HYFRA_00009754 [Hymenoscyphus fraxineus]|uniref:Uncharacterized protein n=1 Tax=Hymenoscyphus fraxineus TaxID=746836 RepID=A0A9N9KSC1_9HELO|nr:hypothetical protein HYFRA_00009754 [Hymenoscyphus fraxineus]
MCVTHIYTDRFPDGHTKYFRQTLNCQYGSPSRPCPTASTTEEATRNLNWGELTAEQILKTPQLQRPFTPPRSPVSSHHRHSSSESNGHRRRHSKHLSPLRPTRQHRKTERIVIVDSPPTPRTPPQHYNHTFTAPSSPIAPPFRSHERERGRPVIVDERPFRRNPSVGAVVGDRLTPRNSREYSRTRHVTWDSPSNSHTSFNSRLRREEEETKRLLEKREQDRQIQRDIDMKKLEKEKDLEDRLRRKEEFFRRQDEEIRSRPAVPLAAPMPPPLRRQQTQISRRGPAVTVVEQDDALPLMMGGLAIREDRSSKRREQESEEAMKRRLRERQLPKRRASVGPGHRRHRVAYDDGLYRWE